MSEFRDYNLADLRDSPNGVYGLAGGLIPEIARATGYELGVKPTVDDLKGFIGHVGPAKTLQDNIALAQELLSTQADATTIAADWADRSGSLRPIFRGFANPNTPRPKNGFDVAVFNTATGRWQERRAKRLIRLKEDGIRIGHVVILAGNREMAEKEHPEVTELAESDGVLPTEYRFASTYIADLLKSNRIRTYVIDTQTSVGDTVFQEGIAQHRWLEDGTVLAVGNAPSAIQVAGQFRKAARQVFGDHFDRTGEQLFMIGDGISAARKGEGPETHQNPFTAIGQNGRNALILQEQLPVQPEDQ